MRRFIDWFFRDRRTGAIVIGQWPNAPLWIFAAASLAEVVLGAVAPGLPPWLFAGLRLAALGALAYWAVDEMLRGVNPWRRVLGAAVLIGLVLSFVVRS
ncbi:hypothetical protein [Methylobacterium sp. Leaf118]|uniref:hypothetical protein n=1 Tax=Methylobacterium sp. Leaf118 TaxID=2876562 RepID=UPI001E33F7CE|nr:hypothetical protein [Methylobacterium sp. Leaf118]